MSSTIAELDRHVIGGVDTHKDFHVAVVINMIGHVLGTARFNTNLVGYSDLLAWMTGHGPVAKIGVEGTGAYGAGLARHLTEAGGDVIEINRPDRQMRRRRGKSDPTDAEAAARAVLSGEASLTPKDTDSTTEAVRALRVVRRSAVNNRTQAANQIHNLVLTARVELADAALVRLTAEIIALDEPVEIVCARTGTIIALQPLARRWQALTVEIKQRDKTLTQLIGRIAPPRLLAMQGVGTDVAGARCILSRGAGLLTVPRPAPSRATRDSGAGPTSVTERSKVDVLSAVVKGRRMDSVHGERRSCGEEPWYAEPPVFLLAGLPRWNQYTVEGLRLDPGSCSPDPIADFNYGAGGLLGLLPPRQASPGVNTCGLYIPLRTSCPQDCVLPPGPFPLPYAVIGAVGSSFCPENAHIEFACVGAAVGLRLPVISPALAIPTPGPAKTTAHTAAVIRDLRNIFRSLI